MRNLQFLLIVFLCSGCTAKIIVQKGEIDISNKLNSSVFYLEIDDGSESNPDNIDGYLNLIWTNKHKRKKVVEENVEYLKQELKDNGFNFVEKTEKNSVLATLKIKSVRFDPTTGWTTDDAKISYTETESSQVLGSVIANEVMITPNIRTVFQALIDGSLELWNVVTEKTHNKKRNSMDSSVEPPIR